MLYGQMREASEALRFEEAGRIYRRIGAIERTIERQKVTSGQERDQDVFGFFREADNVEIQRLTIRGGKLLGGKSDLFTDQLSPDADILESYINQYYAEGQDIPDEVLLPFTIEGREGFADLLSERRSKRVSVLVPERGEKRALVAMANKNAELSFQARQRSGTQPAVNPGAVAGAPTPAQFPAAHRVFRHVQYSGHESCRLDGRLHGWRAGQGTLSEISGEDRRGAG